MIPLILTNVIECHYLPQKPENEAFFFYFYVHKYTLTLEGHMRDAIYFHKKTLKYEEIHQHGFTNSCTIKRIYIPHYTTYIVNYIHLTVTLGTSKVLPNW